MIKYHSIDDLKNKPQERERLLTVLRLLKKGTDKEEVQQALKLCERQARGYITAIKYLKPVISFSGKKGYRLAQSEQDIEEITRATWEYLSRVEEMLQIAKVNLKWLDSKGLEYSLMRDIEKFLDALKKPKKAQGKI